MAARSAEVKSYVLPDVKSGAQAVYARWGMSLSDAVNTFLIKSIEVGGLPFDMRPEARPAYDTSSWAAPESPGFFEPLSLSKHCLELLDGEGDARDLRLRGGGA